MEGNELVFVYGTLQTGGERNSVLTNRGCKKLGDAALHETWRMIHLDFHVGASYPAIMPGEFTLLPGIKWGHAWPVLGELYEVPALVLDYLDQIEQAPHWFDRALVPVDELGGAWEKMAWVYYLTPRAFQLVLNSDGSEVTWRQTAVYTDEHGDQWQRW